MTDSWVVHPNVVIDLFQIMITLSGWLPKCHHYGLNDGATGHIHPITWGLAVISICGCCKVAIPPLGNTPCGAMLWVLMIVHGATVHCTGGVCVPRRPLAHLPWILDCTLWISRRRHRIHVRCFVRAVYIGILVRYSSVSSRSWPHCERNVSHRCRRRVHQQIESTWLGCVQSDWVR